MTVSTTPPAYQMYPGGLAPDMPGHQLTYTGVAPGGKRLPTPSFHALVEIFNPLEHLPIVSTIYQAVTGQEPTTSERIVGDTIYGGPFGFIGAVAHTMVEGFVHLVEGKGGASANAPTAVASATPGQNAGAVAGNAGGAIETGGQARALGLAPEAALAAVAPVATAGAAATGPAIDPKILAKTAQPTATEIVTAEAGPATAALDPAETIDTGDASNAATSGNAGPAGTTGNAGDPGAISGAIAGTGGVDVAALRHAAMPAPVPLPPPDGASATATDSAAGKATTPGTAQTADALRKPTFMPLPQRGPRFFPLNNAPGQKVFYATHATGAPAAQPSASASGAASSPASAAAAPAAAPASAAAPVLPSAMAAAIAPALEQAMGPSTSPADPLSNPLVPSLSPAALATTEAATAKYNQALNLARQLKFFYGGAASPGGLAP